MILYYSDEYVGAKHAFDTTRKSAWIADSLRDKPIAGVQVKKPTPVTQEQLSRIHDPAYVAAVKTGTPRHLAESQGFAWDEALWKAVCASTGGAVEAALTAMHEGASGSLSSGLHHARRDSGMGFCTFNGLALAAHSALQNGAKSVLILDCDAHCGGGTHSLIRNMPGVRQADISTCALDDYNPRPGGVLEVVQRGDSYLPTLRRVLNLLEAADGAFDLCLYNAGMDCFEGCDIGGMSGVTFDVLAEREKLVFSWCRRHSIPVAFVLAGGYSGSRLSQETLVELHRLTIQEAAQMALSHRLSKS